MRRRTADRAGEESNVHMTATVADLMTVGVKTLTPNRTVFDAKMFLEHHRVRHVPIVEWPDEDEADASPESVLIGIVSQRDVLRSLDPLCRDDDDRRMRALRRPVRSIATRAVTTVLPDESIFAAVARMIERQVDCLPVVEARQGRPVLVGLITTRDLLETVCHGRTTGSGAVRPIDLVRGHGRERAIAELVATMFPCVADVMRRHIPSASRSTTLGEAMALMRSDRVRHLPVIGDDARVIGSLSDRDVLLRLPPPRDPAPARPPDHGGFHGGLFDHDPDDARTRAVLETPVQRAMTAPAVTLTPDEPIERAARQMLHTRLGAVWIVDPAGGALRGVVSRIDLLEAICMVGRLSADDQPFLSGLEGPSIHLDGEAGGPSWRPGSSDLLPDR